MNEKHKIPNKFTSNANVNDIISIFQLAHPLVDTHWGPDLLGGDGHPLVFEQLLEGEDWGEDTRVTHGAGPVKNTRLAGIGFIIQE